MNTNCIKGGRVLAVLASLGLSALLIPCASAQSVTWGDTATDFNNNSSWVGGSAPGASDIAEFPVDGTIGFQPGLTADASVSGLSFLQSGYTLSGAHSLTLGTNGISSTGAGTNAVSAALRMGANSTWNIASGNTLNVSSAMNFLGRTLTKTGDGTLMLSASNTAASTSKLVVNSGTVTVADRFFLGGANAADAITLDGGTLAYAVTASMPSSYGMVMGASGGTVNALSGSTARVRGDISGSGTLTFIGGGVTQIEGTNNTHTGDTIINGRVRIMSGSTGLGDVSAVTVNSGGALELRTSDDTIGSLAGDGQVRGDVNGSYTLTTGDNNISTVFSGQIIDAFSGTATLAIQKIGTGTQTLSGSNSYTAGTTISAGALLVGNTKALGSGSVSVEGGTLDLFGGATGELDLGSGSSFSLTDGSVAFTLGAVYDSISGTGSFSLTGGVFDLQNSVVDYTADYQILSGFTNGVVGLGFGVINYDTVNYEAVMNSSGLLTFTAVPEPGTFALLSVTLAGAAFLRFRRKSV